MIKDGGPAFPRVGEGFADPLYSTPGMTLRDWFAGQALAGIMGNPERWIQIADDYKSGKKTYDQCSEANAAKAFSLADAMLALRDVKEGEA